MYYLYLKISPTGLKYLGKFTTRKNRKNFTVYDYLGSGKVWKQHLKKHQLTCKDIQTVVLFESNDLKAFKKEALRISEQFQVAQSEEFANLVPEDGSNPCKYVDFTKRATPEYRAKISAALKGKPKSKEHVRKSVETKKSKGLKAWNKDKKGCYSRGEETRYKMSQSHKIRTSERFKQLVPLSMYLQIEPMLENTLKKDICKKFKISIHLLNKAIKLYGRQN